MCRVASPPSPHLRGRGGPVDALLSRNPGERVPPPGPGKVGGAFRGATARCSDLPPVQARCRQAGDLTGFSASRPGGSPPPPRGTPSLKGRSDRWPSSGHDFTICGCPGTRGLWQAAGGPGGGCSAFFIAEGFVFGGHNPVVAYKRIIYAIQESSSVIS